MKTCQKCGGTEFYETHNHCKACAVARTAAYKEANKEKVRASKAEYRLKNKDKVAAGKKACYEANPEKYKSTRDAWRTSNSERIEKTNAEWKASNPEKILIQCQNRRAKKRNSPGSLSHGLAEKLFALQKGKCPCCKQPLGDNYHMDHVIPLALGGLNVDSNMQLLRAVCNMQKRAKHPVDFMQQRGFLL